MNNLKGFVYATIAVGFLIGCSGNTLRDYKIKDEPKYTKDISNVREKVEIVVRDSVSLRDKTFVVFFDFDKADLTELSKQELDKVKELQNGRIVEVKGYTDIRGSDEYNLDLGKQRAKNVADYLGAKDVNIYSFGKTKAKIDDCDAKDKVCGKADRKAVIEYLY